MNPTLRQLEYVVALARTLNFRQAAEACHVTQPSLSAQVQQLETLLGVALFERDKRSVRVTDAGRLVVDHAQRVLSGAQDLVDAVRATSRPLEGPLRMGVIPTIAPYLLPRAVPPVRAAFPDLELYLREDETAVLVEQVGAGELDLALLAVEADLGDLHVLRLFDEPFLVAAPAGHPFAARESVAETELLGEHLLLLEEGHCLRSQALSICERAGVPDVSAFAATSLSTLLEMVASGLGVTLVPEMAVREDGPGRGLAERIVLRPFDEPAPVRTLGLAWRPSSLRAAEFEQLAGVLATA